MDEDTGQKSEIEQFFSVLQAKRESFAEFMRHFEPTLAPRFNLFDFIILSKGNTLCSDTRFSGEMMASLSLLRRQESIPSPTL